MATLQVGSSFGGANNGISLYVAGYWEEINENEIQNYIEETTDKKNLQLSSEDPSEIEQNELKNAPTATG